MNESDPQDQTVLDQPTEADTEPREGGDLAQLNRFLRRYQRGERIFEQGDEGTTMYFIQQGRVQITKVTPRRVQPLAILEPGSFFGEMAVISGEPRSARAEALDECMLLEIDREILDDFLRSHPHVAQRMIRILAERLRKTDELVERLLEGDPMIQVVDAILDMTKDSTEQPPYVRDVHELMVRSATDPRTLRWVLTRLRRARFLDVDDEGLRIAQRGRLAQYLNFLQMQQDLLAGGAAQSD